MRRLPASNWTSAALALALAVAHGLGQRPHAWEGTPWHRLVIVEDVAVAAVVVTAIALWMKAGDCRSGRLATAAPVASLIALLAFALREFGGDDDEGNPLALAISLLQAASCFAVTGFARLRSRDWRVDVCAAAQFGCMFLPWVKEPEGLDHFLYFGAPGYDGWQWFGDAGVLVLFAILASLLSVHARGFLGDRAIAVRAAGVAVLVVAWKVVELARQDLFLPDEPIHGPFFVLAAALALLWASSALRPPWPAPARTRPAP